MWGNPVLQKNCYYIKEEILWEHKRRISCRGKDLDISHGTSILWA